MWAMDICYLYTRKHDGFDRYLITILDDHSRTVIASGLYERQTVSEVVEVLKAAVLTYGIPQRLVCDRGSQCTCGECMVQAVTYAFARPSLQRRLKGVRGRFHSPQAPCLT
jgi:transposase InsO family protein